MSNWVDRSFPSPKFPLHLDLGFQMAQLFVVNATAANVYLSRGSQSTPTAGADATIPPYTPLPVYNWGSDTVFVGSDGAPLRTTDTLTVYATDDPAASFPAVGIGQPNYYDKPNLVELPFYAGIALTGVALPTSIKTAWTYTVPSGRKASIENISFQLCRNRAGASTIGRSSVWLYLTTAKGVTGFLVVASRPVAAGVGTANYTAGASGVLLSGDRIDAQYSSDSDNTAEELIDLAARVTEFDA